METITQLFNRVTQLKNEYDLKYYELLDAEIELSNAEEEEIESINTSNHMTEEEQDILDRIYKLSKARAKLQADRTINDVDKEQRIYALTVMIKELFKEL